MNEIACCGVHGAPRPPVLDLSCAPDSVLQVATGLAWKYATRRAPQSQKWAARRTWPKPGKSWFSSGNQRVKVVIIVIVIGTTNILFVKEDKGIVLN